MGEYYGLIKTKRLEILVLWLSSMISMFHVFGSDAYVHVSQEKRRKLDAKSKKGIFVGYQEHCKGYRILIPTGKLLEISRNVIIRETERK